MEEYKKLEGKLEWYCLDYWNQRLDLDMVSLKREISHLIKMRDDTIPFLDALKRSGRQVMLLTNAHPGSLALKVEHTNLDDHIDTLISTHEFGVPKEHQSLWEQVFATYQLDKKRTLFVDDSQSVLESARRFEIQHLLAVSNPDSKKPARDIFEFPSTGDFRELLEQIEPL